MAPVKSKPAVLWTVGNKEKEASVVAGDLSVSWETYSTVQETYSGV